MKAIAIVPQVRFYGRMAKPQSDASHILGQRVKAARTSLGLSQIQVWQISGIHFTNIGKIERGEANPALHTLIRLADALNIDPAELVAGFTANSLPADEQALMLPTDAREIAIRRRK